MYRTSGGTPSTSLPSSKRMKSDSLASSIAASVYPETENTQCLTSYPRNSSTLSVFDISDVRTLESTGASQNLHSPR